MLLYRLGRLLQLAGMIILPIAIAGNVYDETKVPLARMLVLCAIGMGVFGFGWLLQQASRSE